MKLKKENKELRDKVKYLENEVCRYSNAIEQEYVLKTDYDELENEIKYSTLLTGETIMNVFGKEHPLLTDKLADKIAKENAESMSNYLYENMTETVAHEIDIEDYIDDEDNWDLMDRNNWDHPQYHQICGYCGLVELGIDEHIFIFEHETKETITTCCECGQDKSVCKELKDKGYTRDQEDD
jgi:hypothetical protein